METLRKIHNSEMIVLFYTMSALRKLEKNGEIKILSKELKNGELNDEVKIKITILKAN